LSKVQKSVWFALLLMIFNEGAYLTFKLSQSSIKGPQFILV